jgi:hypothetical protein
MKKIVLFICLITFVSCSSSKLNSYGKNFEKTKTQAEFVYLEIEKSAVKITETKDKAFVKTLIGSEIINQIVKIPDYIGKIIENNKVKYTQMYMAQNSITFPLIDSIKTLSGKDSIFTKRITLPKVKLIRKISINDTVFEAIKLNFIPVNLNNGFMVFKFNPEKSNINFTKAKTTKSYPFVNLRVIIKGFYIDNDGKGISENEVVSKEMIIPFKNSTNFKEFLNEIEIYSSPFKIKNLMALEIEINETNPYHIKLEELDKKYDENSSELAEILRRLLKPEE